MNKTIVIYGSSTGTCEGIAEKIGAKLGAEVLLRHLCPVPAVLQAQGQVPQCLLRPLSSACAQRLSLLNSLRSAPFIVEQSVLSAFP